MVRLRSIRRGSVDLGPVWPIILVVPPIVVLSVVALYSLREDHAAIDRDAQRNATALVSDLARRRAERAGTELAALVEAGCGAGTRRSPQADGPDALPLCGLVVDGRIRVPVDYPPVPSPPGWLASLAPAHARTLRLLGDAPPDIGLDALGRLAASLAGARAEVQANAQWLVLRSETNRNRSEPAARRLLEFARQSAGVLSDSGAPVSDLALLLALRQLSPGAPVEAFLEEVRRRSVESPSFLTSALVDEAVRVLPGNRNTADLRARWAANEDALRLLRLLSPIDTGGRPSETWLETPQGEWLAFVHPLVQVSDRTGPIPRSAYHVTLLPAGLIERVFRSPGPAREDLPRYVAASVRFAGRIWRVDRARAGVAPLPELASATGQLEVPLAVPSDLVGAFTGELLRVAPHAIDLQQMAPPGVVRLTGVPAGHRFTLVLELADTGALYASYRVRLWVAIALILVTTLAAFAGLFAAWQAFRRERRLAQMKSDFVANVSHELRAPVAAVRLMAESLERGTIEPGARQREYLRLIGQECRRLSSLVANVLDFSRIDRGRRQYTFAPEDLSALVVETGEVMRPYAAERHVKLVCAPFPPGTPVPLPAVDRSAIQQALVNLVDNAIKHSPADAEVVIGGEVQLPTGSDTSGPRICLFVQDQGPGIPADEQERIFEPFHRLESGLRRETQGVGIGLSIVKHVAEAHGGRVLVRSTPGKGSRFVIELPVGDGLPPAA